MPKDWIDFKTIKQAVTMQMVLDRYGIKLNGTGNELRGSCSIHKGSIRSKTFSVNLQKNVFRCFSCKAKGNVLDFVAAMERCDIRDAAAKLAEWFKVGERRPAPDNEVELCHEETKVPLGIYADPEGVLFEVIAPALSGEDFEPMIVYRQLSDDYCYWVAPPENFGTDDSRFRLVKAL